MKYIYNFKGATKHIMECAKNSRKINFTKEGNNKIRCNVCGKVILAESHIPTYSKYVVGM